MARRNYLPRSFTDLMFVRYKNKAEDFVYDLEIMRGFFNEATYAPVIKDEFKIDEAITRKQAVKLYCDQVERLITDRNGLGKSNYFWAFGNMVAFMDALNKPELTHEDFNNIVDNAGVFFKSHFSGVNNIKNKNEGNNER